MIAGNLGQIFTVTSLPPPLYEPPPGTLGGQTAHRQSRIGGVHHKLSRAFWLCRLLAISLERGGENRAMKDFKKKHITSNHQVEPVNSSNISLYKPVGQLCERHFLTSFTSGLTHTSARALAKGEDHHSVRARGSVVHGGGCGCSMLHTNGYLRAVAGAGEENIMMRICSASQNTGTNTDRPEIRIYIYIRLAKPPPPPASTSYGGILAEIFGCSQREGGMASLGMENSRNVRNKKNRLEKKRGNDPKTNTFLPRWQRTQLLPQVLFRFFMALAKTKRNHPRHSSHHPK